ncbi:helix-turn-helix domain-containing protein [Nocardioides sp. BGMRC 2183]|nr:helix-turn-helix domain-containing protein [Nocardioides sp. BGMRC 2183]
MTVTPAHGATATPRWVSLQESADFLGVTERAVRNYVSRGVLPASRIRGSRLIRINSADLEALLQAIPATERDA